LKNGNNEKKKCPNINPILDWTNSARTIGASLSNNAIVGKRTGVCLDGRYSTICIGCCDCRLEICCGTVSASDVFMFN